jgi:hypothetical protein
MKILDLTTDSLLLPVRSAEIEVVHCQSGRAVMHSGCPKTPPRSAFPRLMLELLRARRYDWIIVPPSHIGWTTGNGFFRRLIKRSLRWFQGHPAVARLIRRLVFGGSARFVVTDYSDQLHPSEFALTCIEPVHYFQLNVPRVLVGKRLGPANTLIHYLPTVIQDDLIDSLHAGRSGAAEHDVFVAGTYHNDQRLKQLDASRQLTARGWKVFELGEKSFGKFTTGLLASTLCMSGRGLAYHCFRPLEAAAAGAAPVSHEPEEGTYHEYVHGENCFLYAPHLSPAEIADFVESILKDPILVPKVVEGARALLNQKHRASVLAENILNTIQTPTNQTYA